ncbi:MAG TPA: SDR family oxidoreductase, partial [Pseudonocardiaceae bacterium]
MSTYLVTGGTGFLGRHLITRLLERDPAAEVLVLVRERSTGRLAELSERGPGGTRVRPLVGDLTAPALGLGEAGRAALAGRVDHLVHLAAVYDLTAPEALNRAVNVDGTARVVELANELRVGRLHHVSSVAVAGDHRGRFDEDDLDVGQRLPTPYHATKFEAEALVREHARVPWRVYRPSVVVGDSRTGEMDKVDGPYLVLPMIDALGRLPAALTRTVPVVVPDLGATNLVPVDHVADAMTYLMHADGLDGRAFHLVNPEPQPLVDVYNAFARRAGAPRLVVGVPRAVAEPVGRALAPLATLLGRLPGAGPARNLALRQLGIPPQVVEHAAFPTVFGDEATRRALAGSGLTVPPLEDYAGVLWRYWRRELDPLRARR